MKTRLILATAMLLPFATVDASITITFDLGAVYTAGGANNVADGTIGVLVADAGGTGNFAQGEDLIGVTLSAGNSFGSGGRILGVVNATDDLYGLGLSGYSQNINVSNALLAGLTFGTADSTTGTDLAFYWFPGITMAGAAIADGQTYGFFREDSLAALAGSGSEMSFNLPQDGASLQLAALTSNAFGDLPNDTFQANFVAAIPEPGSAVLPLLSMAGFVLCRRRKAHSLVR